MKLGDNIKHYRKLAGMTQAELGKRLDPPVNDSAVAKWEKGRVENISIQTLKKIADVLGCNLNDLISIEDFPNYEKVENKTNVLYRKQMGATPLYKAHAPKAQVIRERMEKINKQDHITKYMELLGKLDIDDRDEVMDIIDMKLKKSKYSEA